MTCLRTIFAVVLANNIGMAAMAGQQPCLKPGEAQAFGIIGLKSELMVGALSCAMNGEYNQFMTRFQPQIQDAQQLMDNYFVRAGGLAGEAQEDAFTTQLANTQSETANQGSGFCGQAELQFAQVAKLSGPLDLVRYAAGLPLVQPADVAMCPAAPAAPPLTVASAAPPAAAKPRLVRPQTVMRVAVRKNPAPAAVHPPSPYMVAQSI